MIRRGPAQVNVSSMVGRSNRTLLFFFRSSFLQGRLNQTAEQEEKVKKNYFILTNSHVPCPHFIFGIRRPFYTFDISAYG